jgi:hypothetical protein
MGFGGDVTLIGCKIAALNRLPASFCLGGIQLLGISQARRDFGCEDRLNQTLALPGCVTGSEAHGVGRRLPADR